MNENRTCHTCKQKFDPVHRIESDAELNEMQLAGVLSQIIYCSIACKRKAGNNRYYKRHRQQVIDRNNERQKEQRRKSKLATKAP